MTAASYTPSRAIPAEDIRKWDLETDVAIVGFGIAGACAAIEARMAGAAVTIFEVAAAAGGSSAMSGGDHPVLRRRGCGPWAACGRW